jgi:hypothetical protein
MDAALSPRQSPSPSRQGWKKVLVPVEREGGKTFWLRVGAGFPNKDGSLNIYLDVLPPHGKLQLRDWDEPHDGDRRPRAGGGERESLPLPVGLVGRGASASDNETPF